MAVRGVSEMLDSTNVRTGFIGVNDLRPQSAFPYDYQQTDQNNNGMNIARNITLINQYVYDFLNQGGDFFLVVSLGDVMRCPETKYGQFCENFGDGSPGMGKIPDWTPATYDPLTLTPPYFIPRANETKKDLAAMYRSANRLDQGVGLFIQTLTHMGHIQDTLVIYTSTGGVAFPGAQYNAYEGGVAIPLIVSNPGYSQGKSTAALVSALDLTPTILDYFGVTFPTYQIFGRTVTPTGKSLIPVLTDPTKTVHDFVFSTQDLREIQDNFPIRAIRNASYKLIRNTQKSFPITSDVYNTPTFQYILNQTRKGASTGWWRQLTNYLTREQFELFDYSYDPYEIDNVAYEPKYSAVLTELQARLSNWQNVTFDPWICDQGQVLLDNQCLSYL